MTRRRVGLHLDTLYGVASAPAAPSELGLPSALGTPQSPPASVGPSVDGKGKAREVREPEKVAKAGSSSGPAPGSDSVWCPHLRRSLMRQTAREEGPLSTEPDEGIRFGEAFCERARRLGYRVVAEGEFFARRPSVAGRGYGSRQPTHHRDPHRP
jgi:hypothetical protein